MSEDAAAEKKKGSNDGPPEDHPRFQQVYGEKKQLERVVAEKDLMIERMQAHYNDMSSALKTVNQQQNTQQSPVDTTTDNERELNRQKAEAYKNAEFEKIPEIDYKLNQIFQTRLTSQFEAKIAKERQALSEETAKVQSQSIAQEVITNTPWMNSASPSYNAAMHAAAVGWENLNGTKLKGLSDRAALYKIVEEVEKAFQYKPTNGNGSGVLLPSGESGGTGEYRLDSKTSNEVILTDEEKAVAHMFNRNLSHKEAEKKYAENKLAILKSKGGRR